MNNLKDQACPAKLRAIRDALEAVSGKWKIPIVVSLSYGKKRFGEIRGDVDGISPKMLSKELKDLEENRLVNRKVQDSMPVVIEYELTELGISLQELMEELYKWGKQYREKSMTKPLQTHIA